TGVVRAIGVAGQTRAKSTIGDLPGLDDRVPRAAAKADAAVVGGRAAARAIGRAGAGIEGAGAVLAGEAPALSGADGDHEFPQVAGQAHHAVERGAGLLAPGIGAARVLGRPRGLGLGREAGHAKGVVGHRTLAGVAALEVAQR